MRPVRRYALTLILDPAAFGICEPLACRYDAAPALVNAGVAPVLEVVPARRLVYSWRGGASGNTKYGAALDTVVTWTLTPVSQGTRLRLVHAGFRSPENDFAFDAMSPGWMRIVQEAIVRVLREAT